MIKIYKVGGVVRDRLLGLKPKDNDFSVVAPSWEAMKDHIAERGHIWKADEKFFTIRAKMPDLGDADFVLCRKDGEYTDGRRPDEVQMGTLHDDLARRDFTMNAIAIDSETGELIDPFNGIQDIDLKLIRCVGSAEKRIAEDSLRMLRAIRFSVTKGFKIHDDIQHVIRTQYKLLDAAGENRTREELVKMFRFDTNAALNALDEYLDLRDFVFDNFRIRLEPKSFQ